MLRLGSLFSGSGGFELAGLLQGILPVWCSEIEPYPIAVTTSRFPNIKHLGNVKFVDGSKIEPVDIITFGSPCQNLTQQTESNFENGVGINGDKAATIDARVAYVMVENHPADSRIDIDDSGTCQTLTGRMGTGGGIDRADTAGCSKGWKEDASYTLNTIDRPAVVYAVDQGGGKSSVSVCNDVSPTLCTTHQGEPAVAYLANGEKVVGTLLASQGDKMFLRNQEAFSGAYHIVECIIDKNEQCFCVGNGQADQTYLQDKAGVLNCMHDQQCVLKAIALDRATFNAGKTHQGFEISETVNAPLVATGPSAVAYRNIKYIVRRITPVECARLQGFPDKWGVPSKKTDFTDEEYKFWLSVRQNFAQINNKQSLDWNKQSMLNWYNKLHTDSAEYKMWGNGVALPTTLYVMQGIRMVYRIAP